MVRRCTNPENANWKHYGGRGITVCERWRSSFAAFLEDMGPRGGGQKERTLDRIDNSRGYEPGNCRWSTMVQQANNRRDNVVIEHAGRRQTLSEWAREAGVSSGTFGQRIKRGEPLEEALKPTNPMTRVVLADGSVTSVREKATEWGCNTNVLYARIRAGWTVERAFTKRPNTHRPRC